MKKSIIIIVIILIILAIGGIFIYVNNNTEKPENTLQMYISLINEKKYEEMYELISEESKNKISKEDFVTKNKNIYEGIDAVDVKIEITNTEKENRKTNIAYNESLGVSVGEIKFSNNVNLVKENSSGNDIKYELKIE